MYVIGKDFWERQTGLYSLRQFWREGHGWVDFDRATQYDVPMYLNVNDEMEFRLEETPNGWLEYKEGNSGGTKYEVQSGNESSEELKNEIPSDGGF